MSKRWIHESPARWDESKAHVLADAPQGLLSVDALKPGYLLPGDWWRVEEDGSVQGYGSLEATWGDAEILVLVASTLRRQGVGSFILDQLQQEAAKRGLHNLFNRIPEAHPEPAELTRWLERRGFTPSEDGHVLQRTVKSKS